jgi:dCTP deaminase
MVDPCLPRSEINGMTFGLSACGYDIRIDQSLTIRPGEFVLGSSMEKFHMPAHIAGIVHDKSTWARRGIVVQNTVIEPGWRGFLTLEITNHGDREAIITSGSPIAQIVFHVLDEPTEQPYEGKYQDQERGPQVAR